MNDFDQKLHVVQKLSIGNSIETFPIQNTLRFTQNDKKTKNLNIIFFSRNQSKKELCIPFLTISDKNH